MSPFSCAVHARSSTSLQLRRNHFSVFSASTKRSGLKAGAITRRHIRAELAELVSRRKRGRTAREQITFFKSVGFALEDTATARLAYDRAVAANVGIEVAF